MNFVKNPSMLVARGDRNENRIVLRTHGISEITCFGPNLRPDRKNC